ncbi:MAG: CDP-alcohol phosphatidyltransferase family protein [Bacteroidota bacterium]
MKKIPLTLPNVLSGYRILVFPVALGMILAGEEQMFVLLLVISFVTDILDGFIARRFNLRTDAGARLDSIADIGTYILAFTGLVFFKKQFVAEHSLSLLAFVSLYLLSFLVTMIRFGRICGLHLYSFKLTGYLQGLFIVALFAWGDVHWLYYPMIVIGCCANIEEIIIFLILKRPATDVKGLYWMFRNRS